MQYRLESDGGFARWDAEAEPGLAGLLNSIARGPNSIDGPAAPCINGDSFSAFDSHLRFTKHVR